APGWHDRRNAQNAEQISSRLHRSQSRARGLAAHSLLAIAESVDGARRPGLFRWPGLHRTRIRMAGKTRLKQKRPGASRGVFFVWANRGCCFPAGERTREQARAIPARALVRVVLTRAAVEMEGERDLQSVDVVVVAAIGVDLGAEITAIEFPA